MARSLRDLRRKMKAIKATRQVTKAMELVSASKMRRAVQNAVTLRHYAMSAWKILQRIADGTAGLHPFLEKRSLKRVLVVLFTSDRGLCGSLNAQLLRTTSQYLQTLKNTPGFEHAHFVAVGKKGQQFLRRSGQQVVAAFPALSNNPKFKDTLPMAKLATESFLAGTYDHVAMIYMDFVSALVQVPQAKVLLPFSHTSLHDMLESLIPASKKKAVEEMQPEKALDADYTFEPSPQEVLRIILPQITELQVYQAALESAASEHSARMVAMRNATDNASDILGDLTLTYNQTRQAGITGELAELSAATAAMG